MLLREPRPWRTFAIRRTSGAGTLPICGLGCVCEKPMNKPPRMTSGPHTYRVQITPDPETGERSIRSALFPLLVLVGLVVLAGSTISGPRQLLDIMAALGVIGAFYGVLGWWSTRRDRDCREIRLSDDGTCELETKRRTIRLHVNQIRSVLYGRSEDGESYSIRYEGGKLYVDERMTGFHDFLDPSQDAEPGRRPEHIPGRCLAGPGHIGRRPGDCAPSRSPWRALSNERRDSPDLARRGDLPLRSSAPGPRP